MIISINEFRKMNENNVITFDELKNNFKYESEYGRSRYDYGYYISGNENNIILNVYANTKRANTFDVLKYVMNISLPTLPNGYKYTDRIPKGYDNRAIDLQYAREDSEYIDSEVNAEIRYTIEKI